MATATKKLQKQAPKVVVFDDNDGHFRWEIVTADGASLARSGSFGSLREATDAADLLNAGVAPIDPAVGARA